MNMFDFYLLDCGRTDSQRKIIPAPVTADCCVTLDKRIDFCLKEKVASGLEGLLQELVLFCFSSGTEKQVQTRVLSAAG